MQKYEDAVFGGVYVPLYLLACQVRVTVSDWGLCWLRVMSFGWWLTPFVDWFCRKRPSFGFVLHYDYVQGIFDRSTVTVSAKVGFWQHLVIVWFRHIERCLRIKSRLIDHDRVNEFWFLTTSRHTKSCLRIMFRSIDHEHVIECWFRTPFCHIKICLRIKFDMYWMLVSDHILSYKNMSKD